MTWYWNRDGDGTVYDHNGDPVDTIDPTDTYTYPDDIHAIMRESMDGTQPSAYNQDLLADAATNNIEIGTPPN